MQQRELFESTQTSMNIPETIGMELIELLAQLMLSTTMSSQTPQEEKRDESNRC